MANQKLDVLNEKDSHPHLGLDEWLEVQWLRLRRLKEYKHAVRVPKQPSAPPPAWLLQGKKRPGDNTDDSYESATHRKRRRGPPKRRLKGTVCEETVGPAAPASSGLRQASTVE